MDGKEMTFEEAFRNSFPGMDPSNREKVVAAYAAARKVGSDMYFGLLRKVGDGKTKWDSKEEEARVRAAVPRHEDYPAYLSALEKRHAAARLIDSWGEEGAALVAAAGIDGGKFRGDVKAAKHAAQGKVLSFPAGGKGGTMSDEDNRRAARPEERKSTPAKSRGEKASPRPGDPVAWFHAGAVIETADAGRIMVIQGWNENAAVVVGLDGGNERPVQWTRLPAPEDRMEISVSPYVPNGVLAGDFGFEKEEVPSLDAGSLVKPVNALEAEALDAGARKEEAGEALAKSEPLSVSLPGEKEGQKGSAGDEGGKIWNLPSQFAARPSKALLAAGFAAGIAVLSASTYFMSDPDVSATAGQYAGAAYERLQDMGASSITGRGAMAKGSASTVRNPFDPEAEAEGRETQVIAEKAEPVRIQGVPVMQPERNETSQESASLMPGECLDVRVPIVIDGENIQAVTQGCVGPDGEILVGEASRGQRALRGFEIALDEAERRLKNEGLSRRQAVKIADAASKDPGKAKILESRKGLSKVITAMVEHKPESRSVTR